MLGDRIGRFSRPSESSLQRSTHDVLRANVLLVSLGNAGDRRPAPGADEPGDEREPAPVRLLGWIWTVPVLTTETDQMGSVAVEPDWTLVGPISALPAVMVFLQSRTDPRKPTRGNHCAGCTD